MTNSEDLFDWARALAWCPLPNGRSVAVLTNSGGPGVTAADTLEAQGLKLGALLEITLEHLRAELDPAASLHNPIDMLASATTHQYANSLQILLDNPEIDSVLVILPPPPMHTAGGVVKAMLPVIYTSTKPVVVPLMGERLIQEAVELFRAARVPDYRFLERAAGALAILVQRAETLRMKTSGLSDMPRFTDLHSQVVREVLDEGDQPAGGPMNGFLPQESACRILQAYGLPVLPMQLARTPDEAVLLTHQVGFPVALKLASPDIVHKSDVGGVRLNLENDQAVREAFEAITHDGHQAQPEAAMDGVYVQRMVPHGQEVIVGAVQDPQFGALVIFGSGGVDVGGSKMSNLR